MKHLKSILWVIPVVLSTFLIGAHFLRRAEFLFMGMSLIPLPLLLIRRSWSARIIQAILLLATLVWIWTTYHLIAASIAMGRFYGNLLIIMGSVTLFTFLSIFIFESRIMKRRYKLGAEE